MAGGRWQGARCLVVVLFLVAGRVSCSLGMERGVLGSWREMARGLGQRVLSEGRGGFLERFSEK